MSARNNPGFGSRAPRRARALRYARLLGIFAAGMAAWVALCIVTAVLDPRPFGTGLLGLFDGFASWLATGAGLTAAPLVAIQIYRHGAGGRRPETAGFGAAATAAGAVFLAVAKCVMAALAVTAYGLRHESNASDWNDEDYWEHDGWRYGYEGYGYYLNHRLYMTPSGMGGDEDE